jgi:hypothetical protein
MSQNRTSFEIGMESSDVVKRIVGYNGDIAAITLILHHVCYNWRQTHNLGSTQTTDYMTCLEQERPIKRVLLLRELVLDGLEKEIEKIGKGHHEDEHTVVSFTSKVHLASGKKMHLPMMNFHPEVPKEQQLEFIIRFLGKIGEKEGAVLDSGRYFHYYGNRLMSEKEWVRFSASFLKPVILVSPRYVSQRLTDGYSTLRLTKDLTYKPKIPSVVHIL